MTQVEIRNANRVWAAVQRLTIKEGEYTPMTVGEVAIECDMSISAVRKYLKKAVELGVMRMKQHSQTVVTYTRIYQEQKK